MKHPFTVTTILILLFVCAQLIGLVLLYTDATITVDDQGRQSVEYSDTPFGERPPASPRQIVQLVAVGVLIGTGMVFLLNKMKAFNIWRVVFLFAVFFSLSFAFEVFLPLKVALGLAGILALLKVFKQDPFIHNMTEMFIYGGITIFLAPLLNVFWAFILLLAISIYDAYAVWKSKHMITLAKAQMENKMFAGLYIPKTGGIPPPPHPKKKTKKAGSAILGGGDIAFPLLFAGAVFQWLIGVQQVSASAALGYSLLITMGSTVALTFLFVHSKKDKFYPAMPIISAGCLVGFGLIWLLV